MSSEKCHLQWNDFHAKTLNSFQELRNTHDFADVTLVCENNQRIEAHKLILASASNFFKSVLTDSKHSHPLIYMRGINQKDLEKIVDFIYNGEVNIFQEDLNDFLRIGDELGLKLTGLKSETDNLQPKHETRKLRRVEQPNLSEIESSSSISIDGHGTNTSLDDKVGLELWPLETKFSVSFKETNSELDEMIKSLLEKVDRIWTCKSCGKTDKRNNLIAMKGHVEGHIEGQAHPCGHCGKVYKTRNALQTHMYKKHNK